jgi:uncharacterized membrane protein
MTETASKAIEPPAPRIASIDVLRGLVMILMAIDHVRVYSGLPAGGPTAGIFFTRWVTHFAAPTFAFFAGTSAFLHGRKLGSSAALSRYLVSRGLILVVLEMTVLRVSWTFNFAFDRYLLAGVIWMLGWCMVILAMLVRFSPRTVGWIGVVLMIGQTAFHVLADAPVHWLWQLLYLGWTIKLGAGGPTLFVLYTIVPWIGVVAAGYGFGAILTRPDAERRRACLRIGLSAIAVFLVLGLVRARGTAGGGDSPPLLFRLLNQPKYQDNQLFLLMTLGPIITLIPFVETARFRHRELHGDLWPRASVLLSRSHSADPRSGVRGLVGS